MDFEKLYQKYQDGTATEEERKLVEEEIEKAKAINSILEEKPEEKKDVVSKYIDTDKVKDALKYFNFKQMIRTVLIMCTVIVVLAAIVIGTILGVSYYNANRAEVITQEQAITLAKEYVADYGEIEAEKLIVSEVDKEMDIKFNLVDSIYVYEIELVTPSEEYSVKVNSKSGYTMISDIDSDDVFEHERQRGASKGKSETSHGPQDR